METRVTLEEWELAISRAARCELLARTLAYPAPEHLVALRDYVAPAAAGRAADPPALSDAVTRVVRVLDAPLAELRDAHAQVFTHIEPEDCPPYESGYGPSDIFRQTEVMADVAAFYYAHGLRVGGTDRERPDHVCTELEFIAFMARKEACALDCLGADEVDECRRTQVRFLRDHLGCWGPDFGRRVAAVAQHPLQAAVGRLLAAWLDADMAALGVEPITRLTEPTPRPTFDDDDSCGATCAPSACASGVPVQFIGPDEGSDR